MKRQFLLQGKNHPTTTTRKVNYCDIHNIRTQVKNSTNFRLENEKNETRIQTMSPNGSYDANKYSGTPKVIS